MSRRTAKYRPGTAKRPPTVLVRLWIDLRVLGRLALITGLLRVKNGGKPGLGDGIAAIMRGGTKPLLRGTSVEELNRAVEVASRTYTAVEPLLRAVVDAARDTSIPARAAGPSVTE